MNNKGTCTNSTRNNPKQHPNSEMAINEYHQILLITLVATIIFCLWRFNERKKCYSSTNWPVVGMLPGILKNCYRIHDYVTDLMTENNGTFHWKGPWFCTMDMLITSDPTNIHYILSKNFSNYPKGPEFRKIFEILGDGIFNADFELWEFHRRTTLSFVSGSEFYALLERAVWEKVENGLLPVLDSLCENKEADLQDIFQRLTFDSICKLVLEYDPGSLSVEMPHVPCEKAFNDAVEALLHRHVVPEGIWKLQKWMGIGKEKKLKQAWKAFDEFIYPIIDSADRTLLASFRNRNGGDSRKFLRDTALSLMFAGRDTTSTCLTWLFWLIAQNAETEFKIRQEIETEILQGKNWRRFDAQESRKLVYLHGALCESLRLFPPVALEHKAPIRPDNLPSGDYIKENGRVVISFYSVGRMESVWGKDWLEFKPERWIMPTGGIRHEPSYKFPAFNAGPRTCLGKEMAFVQMKMVAAAIIYNYGVKLVEGHPVSPSDSIILYAKHDLRVRVSKRNVFD